MRTLNEAVLVYGLNALWQVTLLTLAASCTIRWMREAQAKTVHRIWAACLLASAVLPATPLLFHAKPVAPAASSVSHAVTLPSPEHWIADGPQLDFDKLTLDHGVDSQPRTASLSKGALLVAWGVRALCWSYLACVAFAFLRLIRGVVHAGRLRYAAAEEPEDTGTGQLWKMCCTAMDVREVRLLRSVSITSPATMTLGSAAVLLPVEMNQTPEEEVAAALCHELAHVKRHDFQKNLVYEMVAALLVFHPAVWWLQRRMQESREMACDDMASAVTQGRAAYAGSLLRLAGHLVAGTQWNALGVFDGNAMEKRVMNLIEAKAKRAGWRVAISLLCSLTVVAVVCTVATRYGVRPVLAESAKKMVPAMQAAFVTPAKAAAVLDAAPLPNADRSDAKPERTTAATEAPAAVEEADAMLGLAPSFARPVSAEDIDQEAKPKGSSVITYQGVPPHLPEVGDLKPVNFKLGETYFETGDSIVIDQILGTSTEIKESNVYQVKGHYTLGSHDEALLAVSVTTKAGEPHHGTSGAINMSVDKGTGDFSVWLFLGEHGSPHMSFYPSGGGSSFASVYFETGSAAVAVPATNVHVGTMPKGWELTGSKPANYTAGLDTDVTYEGHPSLLLTSQVSERGGFGSVAQSFLAKEYAGKRVRLQAMLRSTAIAHWAGLWMRVDGREGTLAFDNMQERPVKGTTDWKLYSVVLDVPGDATGIAMGMLMEGQGQLWMSHVTFDVVGLNVATTNTLQKGASHPVNLELSK